MGLLYPSRKQYDSFTPRTGEYVRLEKRRTVLASQENIDIFADATFTVNVPQGYKATLLRLILYTRVAVANVLTTRITLDNGLFYYERLVGSDQLTSGRDETFKYEDGPTFTSNFVCTFDIDAISTFSGVISILYVLEPAGEGFLV